MRFRYLLDNLIVDEPMGWDQLSKVIKRDKNQGSILVTQDADLSFIGTGYDYLFDKLVNDGFCSSIDCKIQITTDGGNIWTNYYEGIIYISSVEFDRKNNIAKTKVFDNSYNSKIDNNKSIGAFLYGERSKNDVAITPIPYQTIEYFKVTTGAYIAQDFSGGSTHTGAAYKPFDAMKFLIEFMSDGELTFSSSVFDTGGEYEGYLLTHGRAIELADQSLTDSLGNPIPPCTESVWKEYWDKVSWETLFKEYRNRFNLCFAVDKSTTPISIRVEKESYFRDNNILFSALYIDELKTKVDESKLYSKVGFGQGGSQDAQGTSFPFNIDFVGFKTEEFQVVGTCNVDSSLSLQTGFNSNSNDIEYLLTNGVIDTADWDRQIFIVQCTYDTGINWKADEFQILGPPFWYYNSGITNSSISSRFLGAIPNSIASYIQPLDVEFTARHYPTSIFYYAAALSSTVITFTDVISNPSGAYDGSQYFVCPRTGIFTFAFDYYGNQYTSLLGYFRIERYDATLSTLLSYVYLDQIPTTPANPSHFRQYTGSLIANAGDKIGVFIANPNTLAMINISILSGTYSGLTRDTIFSCTSSSLTGGNYQYHNPEDISIYKNEFTYPLSVSDMDTIVANVKGLIEFSTDGGITKEYGWIESIKQDVKTGLGQFVLTSSKKLNRDGH